MTPRALKIALVASLTLNVFALGAVGGAAIMRHRMVEQRARPPMGNPLMRVAEQLPEDVRGQFIARVREQAVAGRAQMTVARQARTEAANALAAPQYDPAVTAAALARARTADDTMRAALENSVVDFARDLKVEERKVLAEGLRPKNRDRDRDRDRRDGRDDRGGRDDGHRGRDGGGRERRDGEQRGPSAPFAPASAPAGSTAPDKSQIPY